MGDFFIHFLSHTLLTSGVLLVPYEEHHVPTYHSWMKDEEIQQATASEPLSIPEEFAMQRSWRTDPDKLTFIACLPRETATCGSKPTSVKVKEDDAPSRMLGDINLFLTPADEDPEGCIGELELMVAPAEARRKGYGRATILTFLTYLQKHLDGILEEYSSSLKQTSEGTDPKGGTGAGKMSLLQLRVKIGSKNAKSINLFSSVGFVKVGEGENYFGEVELVFEGFLGRARVESLLEEWNVSGYEELKYERLDE